MTMPHLMNCEHSGAGWCLDCVKELHDKYERATSESQVVVMQKFSEDSDGEVQEWSNPVALLRLNGPWNPIVIRDKIAAELGTTRSALSTWGGLPLFEAIGDEVVS